MMKKLIVFSMVAVAAIVMSACGNKQGTNDYVYASSTDTTAFDKHSQEYISQRIDTIYSYKNDSLCCSLSFLRLDSEAQELSEKDGTIYRDFDHWVMGQDIDPEWRYELDQVNSISDSAATVTLTIHNYADQKVILDLVFERDDWYVDNFHSFYEGSDYDEDGNTIPDTDGIKELDERAEILKYIDKQQ
ncbi:hypothetical protein SAMN04487827_2395 [Prevotella sp. khp7]|nr:hypothetical protein SAMN04487827_2395 [Prevotella sp. khp7]